ncbi:MAG TPA: PH domain-containing protein [Acidimicrobiales bacterium]|nr:PH domain-containing protein [Acidimicrobiales bacterium]
MPFSRKLLNEGEEIVLESRPNWSLLFWPVTLGVLVLAGLIAALVALPKSTPTWVLIPMLLVVVADLLYVLSRFVRWRTTLLVVTNLRIIYRHGVFGRQGREIPIDRVQDVSYKQTFLERIVRAGSLTIESAGQDGQEPFPDISHPEKMQSMINRLIDVSRDRTQLRTGANTVVQQAPLSVPEQIEKLDELYRRGVLTEDEFNQKKKQLLDRM